MKQDDFIFTNGHQRDTAAIAASRYGMRAENIILEIPCKGAFMNGLKSMFPVFFITIFFACASSPQPANPETAYQKGIDYYSQIIHINPENVQAYEKRAEYYFYSECYKEAIDDFTQAIRLAPQNDELLAKRAYTYLVIEHYQAALEDADKAIKTNPNNITAYNNRASAYFLLGQYDNALSDYSICVELDPNIALYRYNRAEIFFRMERYKEAIDDYGRAIELYPQYVKAYVGRGNVYRILSERADDEALKKMYKQKADADNAVADKYE